MNPNDLRVIKTRRNIEESLIHLLGRKSFEQITVQDILEEALINRSTFYKHYSDKYDLAQRLCTTSFDEFKSAVDERFHYDGTVTALQAVEHLYLLFDTKRELLLRLFSIQSENIHLYDDMFSYLKDRFFGQYESKWTERSQLDYLSTLYASLVMTSIKWYLENKGGKQVQSFFAIFQKCFSELQEAFPLDAT
ncbi:putative TetR family transcriptional regulator [Oscillibacter valericigenes Sjm18-20]|nr:putative TetR family transcriptional regulator [Oscillibacter valericigenes Sjm18-20]